jgi:hypothetical protein
VLLITDVPWKNILIADTPLTVAATPKAHNVPDIHGIPFNKADKRGNIFGPMM